MDTEKNKGQQVSPLGEIELEACRMWFEGYNSTEVERALRSRFGERAPIASTIRHWVTRGGKLFDYYKEYAETEGKLRRAEARDAFRAHLKNAVRVLVKIMNDDTQHTPSRVRAAEMVVNRELGEPVKPVAGINVKNPAREILEAAGLIKKQDDTGGDTNST